MGLSGAKWAPLLVVCNFLNRCWLYILDCNSPSCWNLCILAQYWSVAMFFYQIISRTCEKCKATLWVTCVIAVIVKNNDEEEWLMVTSLVGLRLCMDYDIFPILDTKNLYILFFWQKDVFSIKSCPLLFIEEQYMEYTYCLDIVFMRVGRLVLK